MTNVQKRLEELRKALRAENISYGELIELQSLASHIDPSDVELLEAAGVPEITESTRQLYFVYYLSDAAQSLSLEPELDGVIWLTLEEHNKLEEWGYTLDAQDVGQFDIHPVTPYEFKDAAKYLQPETES